jgi:hypothetical protein
LSYKCPLCLTPLKNGVKLQRYCVKHRVGKEFNCDARTLREETYCSERGDNCNETTDGGVFFRHVGCPHENPFWNAARSAVEVPSKAEETSALFQLDFGLGRDFGVRVQHWLLGVLGLVPREFPEMWFPAMMMRATGETNSLWKRVGVLVELAGAKESGKTVLAMMSMNQNGFALANGSSHGIEVRDFIYSSRRPGNEGDMRRYVETLHLSTLLQDGQRNGLFRPQGTFRSRNVKVSFIKPSKTLQVHVDDGIDEDIHWSKRLAMKALFVLPKLFKRIFSQTKVAAGQVVHGATSYQFWYTVIFYDTAGEANDAKDMQLQLEATDKVAIVVNAAEIFRSSQGALTAGEKQDDEGGHVEEDNADEIGGALSDQSIKTACDRIAKGIDRKQELYLIVTQMDRIKDQLGDDWQRVEAIADGVGSRKLNREAKEMLSKWLERSPAPHASDLKSKLRLVKDVFFVWTEDLPRSLVPQNQGRMPRSRGLAKFICHCLDVKLNEITK